MSISNQVQYNTVEYSQTDKNCFGLSMFNCQHLTTQNTSWTRLSEKRWWFGKLLTLSRMTKKMIKQIIYCPQVQSFKSPWISYFVTSEEDESKSIHKLNIFENVPVSVFPGKLLKCYLTKCDFLPSIHIMLILWIFHVK